ncbi:hypothetical protein ABLN72_10400, partial [Mycobacterium tuberculosis]
ALLRSIGIWVFNLQASQHPTVFAFIVKRFRVFRPRLHPARTAGQAMQLQSSSTLVATRRRHWVTRRDIGGPNRGQRALSMPIVGAD